MKIQCDVCSREEASVFCCADEAALCSNCDRSVHRANKLAGKHRRLPFLLPSSSSSDPSDNSHPLCDICQEKRAFVFCREDRAILCKDCDAPIHTANQLTMKHSRFLLTGARLSATPIPSSSALHPEPEEPEPQHSNNTHPAGAIKAHHDQAPAVLESVVSSTTAPTSHSSGCSFSEYLIKMLSGWRVEDLLVDDASAAAATAADGVRKMDELLPFLDTDLEPSWPGARMEEFPIWVPHVPQVPPPNPPAVTEYRHGLWPKEVNRGVKAGRDRRSEDAFTVPQISPALGGGGGNKRPRPTLWYF